MRIYAIFLQIVLGAFDDLDQIADVCEKYNLWLHVDCCLGGSIIFSQKYKYLLKGIERSNSLSWNPHKSLGRLGNSCGSFFLLIRFNYYLIYNKFYLFI